MIRFAVAILFGFLLGWLVFLKKEINFGVDAAVVLMALMETASYGWTAWRRQTWEAEPKPLNLLLFWRFLAGAAYGILVIEFGDAIGKDLTLVALVPIAIVFVRNLYKIVSI